MNRRRINNEKWLAENKYNQHKAQLDFLYEIVNDL